VCIARRAPRLHTVVGEQASGAKAKDSGDAENDAGGQVGRNISAPAALTLLDLVLST
jgi:hypothetical protein